jgi:hypothetical protein
MIRFLLAVLAFAYSTAAPAQTFEDRLAVLEAKKPTSIAIDPRFKAYSDAKEEAKQKNLPLVLAVGCDVNNIAFQCTSARYDEAANQGWDSPGVYVCFFDSADGLWHSEGLSDYENRIAAPPTTTQFAPVRNIARFGVRVVAAPIRVIGAGIRVVGAAACAS